MLATLRYVPYGIVIGFGLLLTVQGINCLRRKLGKEPWRLLAPVCFFTYLALLVIITFFSRELGSRADKGVDLELFSSWGINARNNAYVIENILLFIPYTFLYCWAYEKKRNFLSCFLLGAVTSLCIECMQLATARGVFQIDDILTNLLGAILGFWIFKLFGLGQKRG